MYRVSKYFCVCVDYKWDNIVFDTTTLYTKPTIKAVLDWELASIGHPLIDLAYFCLPYYIPLEAVQQLPMFIHYAIGNKDKNSKINGIPTIEMVFKSYQQHYKSLNTSKNVQFPELKSSQWMFFICLNLFRMASIVSGVYSRMLLGNASQGSGKAQINSNSNSPSKEMKVQKENINASENYLKTFQQMPSTLMSIAVNLIKPFLSPGLIHEGTFINTRAIQLRSLFKIPKTDIVSQLALEILFRLREFNNKYIIPMEKSIIRYYINANAHAVGGKSTDCLNKARLDMNYWPNGRGVKWLVSKDFKRLQKIAKENKLWNMWMTTDYTLPLIAAHPAWNWKDIVPHYDIQNKVCLSHVEYAYVGIETGRCVLTPYIVNCSAPDTGNMEIIGRIGSIEQRNMYLEDLLLGITKSCFAMTEPNVSSSDPTQLAATAMFTNNKWVINGRKWWTSNALHPDCNCCLFIALTPHSTNTKKHKQHSLFIFPFSLSGITIVRPLDVFGFEDPPHGHAEVLFEQVSIPNEIIDLNGNSKAINPLMGELGSGFEYAQLRLGPGRLHHMSRLVGHCQRAMEYIQDLYRGDVKTGTKRIAFGKSLVELGGNPQSLGDCYVAYTAAKLCVIQAAYSLDELSVQLRSKDHKLSMKSIEALSIAKVIAPQSASKCLDLAIQLHGGSGLSTDHPLSAMWIAARTLRIADGPGKT